MNISVQKSLRIKGPIAFRRLYQITFLLKMFLKSAVRKRDYCMPFRCYTIAEVLEVWSVNLGESGAMLCEIETVFIIQRLFAFPTFISFMNVQ